MDVKDLQNEATLGERNNDGSKYASSGVTLPYSRDKSYQDVSSVSLGKVDAQTSRPCAVIGPDRVLPPPATNDTLKKSAYEAWYADGVYRHPPEYPHKMTNYHTPIRNISPRQTFQENMQRIMVPPSYNSIKGNEEHHFPMDKNVSLPNNTKPNIPLETKYCEVPYSGNLTSNEQKSVRNAEQCASSVNPVLARNVPQGWPSHVRPPRPYGAPELYQYPEYTSCAGPRPVPMTRPHRTSHEDPSHGYPDPYCHDGNIRFKPYTTVKDRYPQARYEFIGNYPNPFHPPSAFPPQKYDMTKSIPQPYAYPQVPFKYLDSRIPDPVMDGYQKPAQQNNYNLPFHNQMLHPAYGPVLGNCIQNKYSCPPEGSVKPVAPNKPPYDANKMYAEYENARSKGFPVSENYYFNEMQRPPHHMKSQVMPNYPVNMHGIPPHPYYRKESSSFKNYEYMSHFRNIDPSLLSQSRIPSQFSPNAITITPPDANLTLESTSIQGGAREDYGYVNQSPTASLRSADYINRSANEFYRRYDSRYGSIIRPPPMMAKPELNLNGNSKDKKDIDVRQFLQMWNEVDDENAENANKEAVPNDVNKTITQFETVKNQDQLYVLGLVNVPSEELGKYEHIQKVSKLPENIKGYNSIELLNQFEEVIESSNVNSFRCKPSNSRDMNYQMSMKNSVPHQSLGLLPRPVSPLDVEAKISQSVIHKEVGCNFEIKPCSPKMLNVEAATPIQNLLGERAIEKVSNSLIVTTPILHEEGKFNCKIFTRQDQIKSPNENVKNTSCKMTNTQFHSNDSVRPNYSLQDLESNSGVCLASLPRLDNDIELNFPEVNQQFINANKEESVITATKDLPSLISTDPTENEVPKTECNVREEPDANYEFPSMIDTEREFSKLSKYRKIKKCESLEKETPSFSSTQNMRTDSVIIKNPENPKMYEQNKDILNAESLKFTQDEVIVNKENIVDKFGTDKELSNELNSSTIDTPMDIAIDFSLNKNDSSHSASSANDNYIGIPIKCSKINKMKHRYKMSENEGSNLLKDQKKEHENIPEPQEINGAETLIETETNFSQMQGSHDYHENKSEKSTIVTNQQFNKKCESSVYKNCVEISEENKNKLKSQGHNDSISMHKESKNLKEKDNCMETHNISLSIENDSEGLNISKQIDENNHVDISHFQVNSSTLPLEIEVYGQKNHKSGSFELFAKESDEFDTYTSNEKNKKQEKLRTFSDKDEIDKILNTDCEKSLKDKLDTKDESNIIEQVLHVKDRINEISKIMNTKEIKNEMVSLGEKSDIERDAIETNKLIKTASTVDENDKLVANAMVENIINEKGKVPDIEKELTPTVKLTEGSDIEEDISLVKELSNKKEVAIKRVEIEEKSDIQDINESDKKDKKLSIEEDNLNESVEIERKFEIEENEFEVSSLKSTETRNEELSQISVPLENGNLENSLYSCEAVVHDIDDVLEQSDTNKILDILEKYKEPTEISNVNELKAVENVTNENSNNCEAFKNKTEYTGNEENVIQSRNKHVDNFSTSTTPSIKNDSLNDCVTLENISNEILMKVDTNEIFETEENVVKSSENTLIEKLQSNTTSPLGCVPQNNASDNIQDLEHDRTEILLQAMDTKLITENELSFVQCTENKKAKQMQSNMSLLSANAIRETSKSHDTNEKLYNCVYEIKDNNISCKDSGFSTAASMKTEALLENAQYISDHPNEHSNQSQLLLKNSNTFKSDEDADGLPLPFDHSLTIISPLNSDEDSCNSPHPNLDMSNEIDSLDHNDNAKFSTIESNQHIAESQVAPLGNESAYEGLEHQTSEVLKITNVVNINSTDSNGGKNKYDSKVKFGLQKELFSPFIQKLSFYNVGYSSNVTICNDPSPSRVVQHDVKTDDYSFDDKNVKISKELIPDNSICKSINNSDIVLANDARVIMDVLISTPVRDVEDSMSSIISDSCCGISQNEHFNIHTNLTDDYSNKGTPDESTVNDNLVLVENLVHNDIAVSSPNYNLKSNFDADNSNLETNNISYIHTDQQLDDSAAESVAMKEIQINDEFTPNNELNVEGAMNVEVSQDLGNNKYLVGSNTFNRLCLKRSLSDSALDSFTESNDAFYSGWQPKRSKKKIRNIVEPDIIFESNCQIHRRKSISSVYNEHNLSFCILIDNDCIITEEECEEQNDVCFTEISEDCINDFQESVNEYDNVVSPNVDGCSEETNPEYSVTQEIEDKTFEESWVDDVGCIETVVSDIAEDITISASSSPERIHSSANEESGIFMNTDHTDKVKHIYGDKMCNDDIMFLETLYRTPQMNVNKVINRESEISDECIQYYNKDSLEKVLSGCNSHENIRSDLEPLASDANSLNPMDSAQSTNMQIEEQLDTRNLSPSEEYYPMRDIYKNNDNHENGYSDSLVITPDKTQDDTVHSCESSIDNVFSYNQRDEYATYTSSTSPEVSSTTSEERNSGILLKIRNYKGSRISQFNDFEQETKSISCKFTELNDYSSSLNFKSNRPLITKAAQKYIPPLKETFGDLKIRLPLPQHSLLRLKQLKLLKEESKLNKSNIKSKPDIPKKPKPKFEDVLKSIDEIQFKMHKEKSKKAKKSIPKVVIKKNENGSHYASTTNRKPYNPDLTGRKWQPWVFLEKNHFIDKMALRNKRKAIFNHRKNTYVLAEKFRKYKSIGNAKFIISQPNLHNSSIGHLKCTIRLKHTY